MGHSPVNGSFTPTGYRQIRPRPPREATVHASTMHRFPSQYSPLLPVQAGIDTSRLDRQPDQLGQPGGNKSRLNPPSLVSRGYQLRKSFCDQHGSGSGNCHTADNYGAIDTARNILRAEALLPTSNIGNNASSFAHPSSGISVLGFTPVPSSTARRRLPPPEPREPDPFRYVHIHPGRMQDPPVAHPAPLPPLSGSRALHAGTDNPIERRNLPPLRTVVQSMLDPANSNGDQSIDRIEQHQHQYLGSPCPYHHLHHNYPNLWDKNQASTLRLHPGEFQHGATQAQPQAQGRYYREQDHQSYNIYENGCHLAQPPNWNGEWNTVHMYEHDGGMREMGMGHGATDMENPNVHARDILRRHSRREGIPSIQQANSKSPSAPFFTHNPYGFTSLLSPPYGYYNQFDEHHHLGSREREKEREDRNEKEWRRREKVENDGPQVQFRRVNWEGSRVGPKKKGKSSKKSKGKRRRESDNGGESSIEDGTNRSSEGGEISPKTVGAT